MEQWFGRDTQDPRRPGQNARRGYDQYNYDFYHKPAPQSRYNDWQDNTIQPPVHATKTMHSQDSGPTNNDDRLSNIIGKMHGLGTRDAQYAILYAQCMQWFPEVAKSLPKPDMFQPQSSVFALQTSNQTWSQPPATSTVPNLASVPTQPLPVQQSHSSNLSSEASAFFRRQPRIDGCAFCTQSGHIVRNCPGAMEYVKTGRATIQNSRVHLPNGQPILNDGSGRGLKHGIDTWLAANSTPASDPTSTTIQPTMPIPFQHDAPPHTALSFEAIQSEVHMAQITDTAGPEDAPNDSSLDDEDAELYNLYEVLATERSDRKKRDTRPPRAQDTASSLKPAMITPPAAPAQPPANATRSAPQYHYQSNAKDQKLTGELFNWLLEGKLTQVTLAHILAASAPICKDLVERLRTRRVEAGGFEQLTTPSSVPHIEPEYSLPLQEIDIQVGGRNMEAGVIDPGSQIVAIRKDLADEVAAHINPRVRLEMEGANGATNWTLGCAEHLSMQVGNISFKLHAHVVEHAPFRLLLGRPFQRLLLCNLEDKPDGRVDITICDPQNCSHKISVPARE